MTESLNRLGRATPTDERTNELTENRGQNQPSLTSSDAHAHVHEIDGGLALMTNTTWAAHLTQPLTCAGRSAHIDTDLVPYIRALWLGGFYTNASCQGGAPTTDHEWQYDHEGYIQFEAGVDVWAALAEIGWDKPGMVCIRRAATHPNIGWVVRFSSVARIPAPDVIPTRPQEVK